MASDTRELVYREFGWRQKLCAKIFMFISEKKKLVSEAENKDGYVRALNDKTCFVGKY